MEIKMNKLSGWLKDENGAMPIGHVLGWETARSDLAGLLRIRIAQNPAHVEKGGVALQLVLPPEQMQSLVDDLSRLLGQFPEPGSRRPQ